MKDEVPKHKFNNLTNSEQKAEHIKSDKSIVIKKVDKASAVVILDK